ncbi:MAG: hypothetical protein WC455_16465 [Dehalococcoidia bacterium]|jgi:hypothetical protein
MGGPWEDYQQTTEQESGPWEDYAGTEWEKSVGRQPATGPLTAGAIKEDFGKRMGGIKQTLADIPDPRSESFVGRLANAPGRAIDIAGDIAGFGIDLGMQGLSAAYRKIVPRKAQEYISETGRNILDVPMGVSADESLAESAAYAPGRAIKTLGEAYGAFKGAYPKEAKRAESVANIAMAVPMLRGLKSAAEFTGGAAEELTNIAGDAARLTARAPEVVERNLDAVIKTGIEKGIRPTVVGKRTSTQTDRYFGRATDAVKNIIGNSKNLSLTDSTGNVSGGLPKSLKQFAESIDQTKRSIYQQYHQMATTAGDQGAAFNSTPILKKLDTVAQDLKHNPQVRKYAEDLKAEIAELHGQSPEIIEARIADLNNSLGGFYEGRVSKAKARVDASVANQMREELDANIMNAVGPGYQDLKNSYGSLKAIEKEVNHRAIVDARKNIKGLVDFTDIFTSGEILTGVLTMNPAMVARGGIGRGVKEYIKHLNSPDRIIKSMFSEADRLMKSGTAPIRSEIGKDIAAIPERPPMELGEYAGPGNQPPVPPVPGYSPEVTRGVPVGRPYGPVRGMPSNRLPAPPDRPLLPDSTGKGFFEMRPEPVDITDLRAQAGNVGAKSRDTGISKSLAKLKEKVREDNIRAANEAQMNEIGGNIESATKYESRGSSPAKLTVGSIITDANGKMGRITKIFFNSKGDKMFRVIPKGGGVGWNVKAADIKP